jgi:hypothetical protein
LVPLVQQRGLRVDRFVTDRGFLHLSKVTKMYGLLTVIGIFAAWYIVMRWVLPRLGVPT